MTLDFDVPLGDPTAAFCRWCKHEKVTRLNAAICPVCDAPAPSITTTITTTTEETS